MKKLLGFLAVSVFSIALYYFINSLLEYFLLKDFCSSLFSVNNVAYCEENIYSLVSEYAKNIKNQNNVNEVILKSKEIKKNISFVEDILKFILTLFNSVTWTVYLIDIRRK